MENHVKRRDENQTRVLSEREKEGFLARNFISGTILS